MAEHDMRLRVAGRDFSGWTSLHVQRGMEQAAGSFRVGASTRGPGGVVDAQLQPGQACEVLLGEERVLQGYLDAVSLSATATSHEMELAGRDKTADLVDCSAVAKGGQWRGLRIEQIAAQLAEPFGVAVRAEVDTGKPLASFALQPGETVFEAVERAARVRALLVMTDGAGALVLTRAGAKRVAQRLELGQNVLTLAVQADVRDRHSEYVLLGQAPAGDYFSGKQVSQIRVTARDPGVVRYRPLWLLQEQADLAATLKDRALWEASVRAARGVQVVATVQGWRHAAGLWEPNTRVQVRAPSMRLDGELLITSVEHSLDDAGMVTRLQLTRADAYSLLPLKERKAGADSFWAQQPIADPKVTNLRFKALAGGR